jgi:hypothetical protein
MRVFLEKAEKMRRQCSGAAHGAKRHFAAPSRATNLRGRSLGTPWNRRAGGQPGRDLLLAAIVALNVPIFCYHVAIVRL